MPYDKAELASPLVKAFPDAVCARGGNIVGHEKALTRFTLAIETAELKLTF